MNIKQMITKNNERRQLLNPDNLKVYEDALVYIRLNTRSEYWTESILLDLLDHLIEAQQHGKIAEDVFGDDLHVYCDTLIADIPPQSKRVWIADLLRFMFILLSSILAVQTLFQLLAYSIPALKISQLSLVPMLAILVIGGLSIPFLLYTVKASVFGAKGWLFAGIIIYSLEIGAYVLSTFLFKKIWLVPVNAWSLLIAALLFAGLAMWMKRVSEKADRPA